MSFVKPAPLNSDLPLPFSYSPSPDKIDANLLILLHGVGDNEYNFIGFGKQLKLPQTAVLALRAPQTLLDLGYQWFPWFGDSGEEIEFDVSRLKDLAVARDLVKRTLLVLKTKFNWDMASIFILGNSQGAILAAEIGLSWNLNSRLGGILCFDGLLLEESLYGLEIMKEKKRLPPLYVAYRSSDPKSSQISKYLTIIKSKCENPEDFTIHQFSKGSQIVSSQDEARKLKEYFAKNLKRRNPAMESSPDLIEVTPQNLEKIKKLLEDDQ